MIMIVFQFNVFDKEFPKSFLKRIFIYCFSFKALMDEVRGLEGKYKDVVILSENVIRYK